MITKLLLWARGYRKTALPHEFTRPQTVYALSKHGLTRVDIGKVVTPENPLILKGLSYESGEEPAPQLYIKP